MNEYYYDEYEEVDDSQYSLSEYNEEGKSQFTSMIERVGNAQETISQITNLGMNIASVYAESKRLNAQLELTREVGKFKLAQTAAKFKLAKMVIEKAFAERETALSHFYTELDRAIEKDDPQRILNAMKCIGSVVVTSPLADIQKFTELFNDTSQPLLDF